MRKRVTTYIAECLNSVGNSPAETDVDDMNLDSLKEQGEKLSILGSAMGSDSSSQLSDLKRGPIAGAMNAKKMRKVVGAAQPLPGVKKGPATIDERKELLRLKREIREKKALEKRL